jgi:pyridoxal phosphate enzyme (YggS family)
MIREALNMNIIANNLMLLRERIAQAEQNYGRVTGEVNLLAVSKAQPLTHLQQAIEAGQQSFGENYLREALLKIEVLADRMLEWHFIGKIQSNKTQLLAKHFAWVHTVDRFKVAERLSAQRPENLPPLNICIEVNIDEEANKAGVKLVELTELAFAIEHLPQLKLRGLMAIPAARTTFEEQREPFRKLRIAFEELKKHGLSQLDTLSMGMSNDFVAAIAEGATIVRVGTKLFGERAF